jgi:LysR family transcriptional regulator, glycine cleavage system transcriptional activator
MKLHSPSLVELHAFLAVSRLGSFRLAAEELCVTQAAVSRAVQRLEEHLGDCRLFDRSPQGVSLTEQGRQLRRLTQRHVMALESAAALLLRPQRHRAGSKLRLAVIPTLGTQWLLPRLARFRSAYPGVDVEMRQYRHDDEYTRDDVDVWIAVKRPRRRWPARLQTTYLLGREIVPVCAPSLLPRLRQPGDLAEEVLLHHTNFPDNWARWAAAAGLAVAPSLGPGYDLSINLIFAAKAGLGIALTQPCLIERELESGELVKPFDLPVDTGRGYFVCVDARLPRSPAQRAFLEWIKTEARRSEPAR